MTIRQQGGVFGRNPKFGNVEADQASIDSLSVGENFSAGDPTGVYLLNSNSNCYWNIQAGFNTKNSVVRFTNNTDANVAGIDYDHLVETMRFFTASGASVTLNNSGNLAFNSGAGIDFSATSGTGTSELFDDYEEGTWTPAVASSSGTITTVGTVAGFYTKVGRLVTAHFSVAITDNGTGSGFIVVTGLPFVPSASAVYAGSGVQNTTAKSLSVTTINASSQTYIRLYDGTYPASSGETLRGTVTYMT